MERWIGYARTVGLVDRSQEKIRYGDRGRDRDGIPRRVNHVPCEYEGEVWIYRVGQSEPELLERPQQLGGEDVLEGLIVELGWLWESD